MLVPKPILTRKGSLRGFELRKGELLKPQDAFFHDALPRCDSHGYHRSLGYWSLAAVFHLFSSRGLRIRAPQRVRLVRAPDPKRGISAAMLAQNEMLEHAETLSAGLQTAIGSARRLRGHPVPAFTLEQWRRLLHQARNELHCSKDQSLAGLISGLECAIAELRVQ
jgi:hypothetical protein